MSARWQAPVETTPIRRSGPLGRLIDAFVAPSPGSAGNEGAAGQPVVAAELRHGPPPGGLLVVLGAPEEARLAGAALASSAARNAAEPCALLCTWAPGAVPVPTLRAPARPAVRRLAALLERRGHAADPRGRLVEVRLEGDGDDAAGEAEAVLGSASDVPAVLVVAGPRSPRMDAVLRGASHGVVAARPGADEALIELAAVGLARLDVPADVVFVRCGPLGRWVGLGGGPVPAPVRRALAPASIAAAHRWETR